MKALFLIAIAGLVFLSVMGSANITYQFGLLERPPTPKPSIGILTNPAPAAPTPTPPGWPLAFQGPAWTTRECAEAKDILKEDRGLHQLWLNRLEQDGLGTVKRLNPGALLYPNPTIPAQRMVNEAAVQEAISDQRRWRDTFQTMLNDFEAACDYFKVGPRAPSPWIAAQCARTTDRLAFARDSHRGTLEAVLAGQRVQYPTNPEWDRQWIASYQFLLGMATRICN